MSDFYKDNQKKLQIFDNCDIFRYNISINSKQEFIKEGGNYGYTGSCRDVTGDNTQFKEKDGSCKGS